MNVFVLSHRCGHCILHQAVYGEDEYNAVFGTALATRCPLCGVRTQSNDDLVVLLFEDEVEAINSGGSPWRKTGQVPKAVSRFLGVGDAARTAGRGDFAASLRDRYSQTSNRRTPDYQKFSDHWAKTMGFQFGNEAYEKGDFARAALWFERAGAVLEDPTHLAVAQTHLGLALQELGENRQAMSAFRAALDCKRASDTVLVVAATQLAPMLQELGDIKGARDAYRIAVDLNVSGSSETAAVDLGVLEYDEGNRAMAKALWDRAYRSSGNAKAGAAHNLGWYWEQAGDLEQARRYYKVAAKSKVQEVAPRAAARLRVFPPAPRRGFFGRKRR